MKKDECCPKCGHCPTCGRSNQQFVPYPYPVYPVYPNPYETWPGPWRQYPITATWGQSNSVMPATNPYATNATSGAGGRYQ